MPGGKRVVVVAVVWWRRCHTAGSARRVTPLRCSACHTPALLCSLTLGGVVLATDYFSMAEIPCGEGLLPGGKRVVVVAVGWWRRFREQLRTDPRANFPRPTRDAPHCLNLSTPAGNVLQPSIKRYQAGYQAEYVSVHVPSLLSATVTASF